MYFTRHIAARWILPIVLLIQSLSAIAQNLNGEKIKVSAESITALKFNATIMDYQWSDPSGYTCIARNNDNTLLIKTLKDDPAPTNLIVSEGKRTHYFIIDFVTKIDINNTKLYYDYSDLKQLKKLVQSKGANEVAMNTEKEPKAGEEELSSKEKKRIEKESEDRKKAAEDKRKQDDAERGRLAAEQKEQIEKVKRQEREESSKRKEEQEEKDRLTAEKKRQEDNERERKEQERLDVIAKQQQQIREDEEKQQQLLAQKEAERKRKAEAEAARIKKINDEKEAAEAALKEKQRLEAERKKQIAEEKARLKEEQERQRQMALLKEQQRKEEEKQKQLAKMVEEKRKTEEAERLRREAEANKTEYTHAELWKKYPKIVFADPPPGQHMTGEYYIPADTAENHRVASRLIGMDYWLNISSQTLNGVTMTMQSMIFSGVNSYMRVTIRNNSDNDFLVGKMVLRWMKSDGESYELFPCYLTGFPVVLPHKESVVVYASRAVNAGEKDKFVFTMSDRLNTTNLELKFNGSSYNLEMSR